MRAGDEPSRSGWRSGPPPSTSSPTGRLEFGTARSSTWTELGGFEVDPDDTKKTWDEFVRVLPRMWADEPFAYEGRCFSMPERSVLPKPVQKPHPPMWVTVTSPGTELDAADRGLGCLGVAATGYADQERRTLEYHRRVQNCDPVSSVVNDQVTTLNFLYCHEDPDRAADTGMRMVKQFGLTQLPPAVDPGGLPHPGLPIAGQPGAGRGDRPVGPWGPNAHTRRDRRRRSRPPGISHPAVGVHRRGPGSTSW